MDIFIIIQKALDTLVDGAFRVEVLRSLISCTLLNINSFMVFEQIIQYFCALVYSSYLEQKKKITSVRSEESKSVSAVSLRIKRNSLVLLHIFYRYVPGFRYKTVNEWNQQSTFSGTYFICSCCSRLY